METNVRQLHSFHTIELESHNCYEEYIENFVLISKTKDYKKDPDSYLTGIIRQTDINKNRNKYNNNNSNYDSENENDGDIIITVIIDIEKWKVFRKGINKLTYLLFVIYIKLNSKLYVYKSEQLSSTIREYLSIKSVHLFPLLNQLLRYQEGV